MIENPLLKEQTIIWWVPDDAGDVEADELPLSLPEQRARVALPLADVDVGLRILHSQGCPRHVHVDLQGDIRDLS